MFRRVLGLARPLPTLFVNTATNDRRWGWSERSDTPGADKNKPRTRRRPLPQFGLRTTHCWSIQATPPGKAAPVAGEQQAAGRDVVMNVHSSERKRVRVGSE
jgi:hypothetical protein